MLGLQGKWKHVSSQRRADSRPSRKGPGAVFVSQIVSSGACSAPATAHRTAPPHAPPSALGRAWSRPHSWGRKRLHVSPHAAGVRAVMAAAPPRPPPKPRNGRLPPHPSGFGARKNRGRAAASEGHLSEGPAQPRSAESPPQPAQNRYPTRPRTHLLTGRAPSQPSGAPERSLALAEPQPPPAPASGPNALSPPRTTMTEQRARHPLPPRTRAAGGPAPFLLLDFARPFIWEGAERSSHLSHSEGRREEGRHTTQVSPLQRSVGPSLAATQPTSLPRS